MVSIVVASNAAPRVEFGAEKLAEALKAVKLDATIVHSEKISGQKIHLESAARFQRRPRRFSI